MAEDDPFEEYKGWEKIAIEADLGTDDTARARSKDPELPLPVHYRGRFVFAIRSEIEFWKRIREAVTGLRRRYVAVARMVEELRSVLASLAELRGSSDADRDLLRNAEAFLREIDSSAHALAFDATAVLRRGLRR
jgi:hypothetical protein